MAGKNVVNVQYRLIGVKGMRVHMVELGNEPQSKIRAILARYEKVRDEYVVVGRIRKVG